MDSNNSNINIIIYLKYIGEGYMMDTDFGESDFDINIT
jgi:hypothetical protein